MMGRREGEQGQFFYSFHLDKVVPPDHLVRQIDGLLDLDWVHKELAPYYSHTGRPSIDPVLMIRMLLIGYIFAIRSERRICAEIQVNLAYRWFCKLGIEDRIPDHSVFCRARNERFRESDALRRVRIGKRDFFGRLAPLAAFARTVVATTILLTASGIESYEILANRMGCFLRLRPRKRLVAGDPLRLVYIRLDQARIDRERFASNQPGPNAHRHHALKYPA
jgi:transposase